MFLVPLELCRGSTSDQWQLIHKCLIYQRRKQKTTPTNDKMTATVPTFLCLFLLEKCFERHLGQLKLNLETELRRNVFGASDERYRLLRASGFSI
jgi:hypothetical protein